ncbi:MAG TPA: thiolase family protein [Polyangiaceae bacterium]|jgi:acetyl-CoA C-acetyltransferase|nr:MAG: putative acetyl-CoA acyltransferase [Deltaproteobacteria bacterium ADurb.Bin207]HNS99633.1 thiolase family protein [Polyangiaceae bacterium]HNZ22009.1 thiolase family protein [Polyangiaceae bacterium]HOD25037.1 thiolase family protein [Polyangiaceae bacterium]HOE47317.1 thiolase family protein [Polyangiaceae bacterium]
MSEFKKVVIVGAVRTPIGSLGGGLASLQARELATHAIKALLDATKVDPSLVQYTCMGWVMQDPRSPNIAKTAAEFAGVPPTSPGTTFHENCASGGAAIHSLARRLMLGEVSLGVAGGVESMSNVPRYLFSGRFKGQVFGDLSLVDGLFGALTDTNVGKKGELMGLLTERLVERYTVTRQEQDEIAFRSHHNALSAWTNGYFDDYVVPVSIPHRKGEPLLVAKDEGPKPVTMEALGAAKPYFKPEGGTITSLNASSLNDAAAAVMLTTEDRAKELGLVPLAELRAFHNVGVEREYMGEGAFKVIPPLLEKIRIGVGDVDLFEINEAFAAVVAGAYHFIEGLAVDKTNLWGSGISLGHPVGCTGARQIVDMVHQLRKRDKSVGVTTRCVGGGIGSGEVLIRMN